MEKRSGGRNFPFASVSRTQIGFNSAACKLLDNYERFQFACFYGCRDTETGRIVKFKVKFLEEYEEDSVKVSRLSMKRKFVSGMVIRNKKIIEEVFEPYGLQNEVTRYKVVKLDDCTLLVVLPNSILDCIVEE